MSHGLSIQIYPSLDPSFFLSSFFLLVQLLQDVYHIANGFDSCWTSRLQCDIHPDIYALVMSYNVFLLYWVRHARQCDAGARLLYTQLLLSRLSLKLLHAPDTLLVSSALVWIHQSCCSKYSTRFLRDFPRLLAMSKSCCSTHNLMSYVVLLVHGCQSRFCTFCGTGLRKMPFVTIFIQDWGRWFPAQ